MLYINLLFAGVGHLIWHWGLGIGVIILLGVAYFASASIPVLGPYLHTLREWLLVAAAAIALLLAGEFIGAKDMAARNSAQQAVVSSKVHAVVTKSLTPAARARKDKWDDPKN